MTKSLAAAIEQIQEKAAELQKKEKELNVRELGLNARQRHLDQLTNQIAERLRSTISDDLTLLHSASRNLGIEDEQNQATKTSVEECDAADKLVKDLKQKVEYLQHLDRKAAAAAGAAAEAALAAPEGDADHAAAQEALERAEVMKWKCDQNEVVEVDQRYRRDAGAGGEGDHSAKQLGRTFSQHQVELVRNNSCAGRNKDGIANR